MKNTFENQNPTELPEGKTISIGKEPFIVERENSVLYLGVEVPKGNGGPLVPEREESAKYFYTKEDYILRREIATSLVLNKPMIFEGGTGIGKTSAVAAMCAELNTNYCKVSFGREMAIEDIIGGKTITTDEKGNEVVKWYDGNLLVAIRNGGIAFLDEYNLQGSKIGSRVNPIIDAVLNGRKEISLPENDNERVAVHPNFRILAAQNPPGTEEGQEFIGRDVLSAETFGRWTFQKLPLKMSKEMRNQRMAGMMGENVSVEIPEDEFRSRGEGVPQRELKDIPGMAHWRRQLIDIIDQLETSSMGAARNMARDQRQKLYFNPRLEQAFINYVSVFYREDVNKVWKNAFEHLIIGMYKSDTDKEKIREILTLAEWKKENDSEPPTDPDDVSLPGPKKPEGVPAPEASPEAEKAVKEARAALDALKKRSGIESLATAPSPEALTQLKSWQTLYREGFGKTLDISKLTIPEKKEGFDRLVVVMEGLTLNEITEVLKRRFPVFSWTTDLDANTPTNDRDAKKEPYAIWIKDAIEADENLKNISANDLAKKKIQTITLKERLLLEAMYFKETGKHLDETTVTLCAGSRYSDGDVSGVFWFDGKLNVGRFTSGYAIGILRARAVVS